MIKNLGKSSVKSIIKLTVSIFLFSGILYGQITGKGSGTVTLGPYSGNGWHPADEGKKALGVCWVESPCQFQLQLQPHQLDIDPEDLPDIQSPDSMVEKIPADAVTPVLDSQTGKFFCPREEYGLKWFIQERSTYPNLWSSGAYFTAGISSGISSTSPELYFKPECVKKLSITIQIIPIPTYNPDNILVKNINGRPNQP